MKYVRYLVNRELLGIWNNDFLEFLNKEGCHIDICIRFNFCLLMLKFFIIHYFLLLIH